MNALPINGVCECGLQLVPQRAWQALSKEDRLRFRKAGLSVFAARLLCAKCYVARRKEGTLLDVPRRNLTQEEIVEAWHEDDHRAGDSDALRIRRLAPRIGMTIKGLEKAIQRAKQSGALSTFPRKEAADEQQRTANHRHAS